MSHPYWTFCLLFWNFCILFRLQVFLARRRNNHFLSCKAYGKDGFLRQELNVISTCIFVFKQRLYLLLNYNFLVVITKGYQNVRKIRPGYINETFNFSSTSYYQAEVRIVILRLSIFFTQWYDQLAQSQNMQFSWRDQQKTFCLSAWLCEVLALGNLISSVTINRKVNKKPNGI